MKKYFLQLRQLYRQHAMLRNFAAIFSIDVVVKLATFVLMPVYLNLMSPSEYGAYNYWLSILNLVGGLLYFGLHVAQSKLYLESESPRQRGTTLFTINTLQAFLAGNLLYWTWHFEFDHELIRLLFKNQFDYAQYRPFLFLSAGATIYLGLFFNLLVLERRIKQIAWFSGAKLVFFHALVIGALLVLPGDKTLLRVQATSLAEWVVVVLFAWFYFGKMKFRFDWQLAWRALRIGLPFQLASLPGVWVIFIDKFYLEKAGGYADLSIYYVALNVASVIGFVAASFINAWMPEVFAERDLAKNFARNQKLLPAMAGVLAITGMGAWLSLYLLVWMGWIDAIYYEAAAILPVLIASQILMVGTNVYSLFLVYLEKTAFHLYINLSVLPVSWVANYLLILHFDMWGAIAANVFQSSLFWLGYRLATYHEVKRRLRLTGGAEYSKQGLD